MTTLCEQFMCELCETTLCVNTPCGSTLCMSTLCMSTLCGTTLCEPHVWVFYVWALYVWAFYVGPLYVTTLREPYVWARAQKHTKIPPQQDHHKNTTTKKPHLNTSLSNVVLGPEILPHHHKNTTTPPPKYHHTNTTAKPPKYHHKNTATKTPLCVSSMGERDLWALCASTLCKHKNRKIRELARKKRDQFLGRMWQDAEKYENYHANRILILGSNVMEHRKIQKLPRKFGFSFWAGCCSGKNVKKTRILLQKPRSRTLQNTEKYENYHEK